MPYDKQHFSPVFANKRWANEQGTYVSYFRDERARRVLSRPRGKRQWGRQRHLWPRQVELALSRDLDDPVAPIYEGLLHGTPPSDQDRVKFAQFLLSQAVRTPSFIRYERGAQALSKVQGKPLHDRVGCQHCADLLFVTSRRWCLLVAHDDDYFVRTDNPVHLTGFVECASTTIYYPLAPRICFMATPLVEGEVIACRSQTSMPAWPLPKGGAWMVNFYLAKYAYDSIILRSDQDGDLANKMFGEVLGVYPQPPFPLHSPQPNDLAAAFESIRLYQSAADGCEYPAWSAEDLERTGAIMLEKTRGLEASQLEGR